jgi:serine/threonine protein kinase
VTFEPPNLVGAVLSQRFRLVRLVGYGGMGSVYATDAIGEGGAPLAVKILNPECLDNAEIVTRFLDEGRSCQGLRHPNILRVFEVAVAESGAPYIVMELLRGVPLSTYTSNGTRVPLLQCVAIVRGILAGLSMAHARGLVHRDLKPENVFLAQEGKAFTVKLLDFGIAKVMDLAGGMGARTKTGALLGTPAYMSPEQILGPKDVDARSDLFSVGVLAYEMLTGRAAFPAPTEYAKLAAVLNTNPAPIESVDPALIHLKPFFERALQKSRDARFQSAADMAGALNVATGGNPQEIDTGIVRLSSLPHAPGLTPMPSGFASPMHVSVAMPNTAAAPVLVRDGQRHSTESLAPVRPSMHEAPRVSVPPGLHGGTLPSHDIPMLEARDGTGKNPAVRIEGMPSGVSRGVVAVLCAICLVIGIGIGVLLRG